MPVERGLCAQVELTVDDGDTAVALGSGDVPVLGTSRIVALCEEASVAAVRHWLAPGHTTVSHTVQLDYLAPTRVGDQVRADATLQRVTGRRLVFTVSVSDGRGLVAAGKMTRVVVATDRYLEAAR